MYERFTDRARKVMQLANQEAQRCNHKRIDTHHVLVGLVKEGSGVAAHALMRLDVDLRKIRREAEKIVPTGPDMVTMGKLPHTPDTKAVVEGAIVEAKSLGCNHVGTEHILAGLLHNPDSVACKILAAMGVTLQAVRDEVLGLLGKGQSQSEEKVDPGRRLSITNDAGTGGLVLQVSEDVCLSNEDVADFRACLASRDASPTPADPAVKENKVLSIPIPARSRVVFPPEPGHGLWPGHWFILPQGVAIEHGRGRRDIGVYKITNHNTHSVKVLIKAYDDNTPYRQDVEPIGEPRLIEDLDAAAKDTIKQKLQEIEKDQEACRTLVMTGVITINDYRRFLGCPPRPGGDITIKPVGPSPAPLPNGNFPPSGGNRREFL